MNDGSLPVSIVIPVYNVERYLCECLDSVLSQTLRDIEVICVNDGSTDGSLAILKEYEARDSRLRVIDKQNEGVSVARNTGLDAAQGEFILFVDADDTIDKELCEKTCRKAVTENLDLVVFEFNRFSGDGTIASFATDGSKREFSSEMSRVDKLRFLVWRSVFCWDKLSRRRLLQDNNVQFPQGITHGEDCVFHWKVICLSKNPGYMKENLYYYRVNLGSATYKKKMLSTSVIVYEQIENFLRERGLYREMSSFLLLHKVGNYRKILTQQYEHGDKEAFSESAAYVKKTTSFGDVPRLFRSTRLSWKNRISLSLFVVLTKMNLAGFYFVLKDSQIKRVKAVGR